MNRIGFLEEKEKIKDEIQSVKNQIEFYALKKKRLYEKLERLDNDHFIEGLF